MRDRLRLEAIGGMAGRSPKVLQPRGRGCAMSRQEQQRANREARRDMAAQPARERPHESAMAAFMAGIAYEEKQHEDAEREDDEQNKQS